MLMKTDQQEENRNTVYEIGCLFVPIISDKDVLTEVSKIKSSLEKLDCDFLSGDGPDTKELAYPMKKMIDGEKHLFVKAYFVWLKFTANSDKLIGLKEGLDKNKNILRYLLIRTIKKDILVLSIERKEQLISFPHTKDAISKGDKLLCYGLIDNIKEYA